MLGKIANLIVGKEPVMFATLVSAALGLAVAFGWDISEEQLAAITAAATALAGFLARAAVTPVAKGGPDGPS
jgi:hypothetical protein